MKTWNKKPRKSSTELYGYKLVKTCVMFTLIMWLKKARIQDLSLSTYYHPVEHLSVPCLNSLVF